MRLPALFYLLIASCVSVFLACGASDELRDSSDELPDDFILSDDVAHCPIVLVLPQAFCFMVTWATSTRRRLNLAAEADWLVQRSADKA